MAKRKQRDADEAVVIAVVSDLHTGSTVGLCPPGPIELDDGGSYQPSTAQQWLWQCWRDYWAEVERVRDRLKAPLFTVLNGDAFDGDHHGTSQIISRNPMIQAQVASEVMDVPKAVGWDKLFVVRGTESHVGGSGSTEEGLARALGATGDPDTGNASWWHLRMDVQDVRLDFAHHGRTGYRPWTRHNATLLLAAQIFYEHAANGERHPDLAIRSHFHRHSDSHDAHPVRVLQTPAWQLKTAYVHKVAPESIADVGGLIITIEDGHVDVRKIIHRPKRGAVWTA